jgi:hypothetical protein
LMQSALIGLGLKTRVVKTEVRRETNSFMFGSRRAEAWRGALFARVAFSCLLLLATQEK